MLSKFEWFYNMPIYLVVSKDCLNQYREKFYSILLFFLIKNQWWFAGKKTWVEQRIQKEIVLNRKNLWRKNKLSIKSKRSLHFHEFCRVLICGIFSYLVCWNSFVLIPVIIVFRSMNCEKHNILASFFVFLLFSWTKTKCPKLCLFKNDYYSINFPPSFILFHYFYRQRNFKIYIFM